MHEQSPTRSRRFTVPVAAAALRACRMHRMEHAERRMLRLLLYTFRDQQTREVTLLLERVLFRDTPRRARLDR